jgi:hypothetical protein
MSYSLFIDYSVEFTAFIFKVEREDGGSTLARNAGRLLPECKADIPEDSFIHTHIRDNLIYLIKLIMRFE